jgi:CRP/FNR family transcriptional regulator, cyclic AMP receptor protein
MTDYALPALVDFLTPAERAEMASLGRRQHYDDGAMVQKRGDVDAEMALVIKGAVRVVRIASDGRHVQMMTATAGQHYADNTVLSRSPRTHHAFAVGETIIDHFSREVFMQLLEKPPIVKALYLVSLSRLTQAIELFDDIRCLTPEVRLAKVLSAIRRSAGGASRLDCTQEELASLMGVSAMTLSKSLKAMKKAGLIDTGYRTVTILDHLRFDQWLADQLDV